MTTEPTEARQDELAGIREKIWFICQEIRTGEISETEATDQILNDITVSSGGGKCDHYDESDGHYWVAQWCPTCHGTGQQEVKTITIEQAIEEALNE